MRALGWQPRRFLLAYLAVGGLVGLLCLALGYFLIRSTHRSAVGVAQSSPVSPHIEEIACWFALPAQRSASCGELIAPESISGGDQRSVRLRFVLFKAAADAGLPPLVYINGGPGVAAGLDADAISAWWTVTANARWLRGQDVLVFDQRGVGLSTPSLACPEMTSAGEQVLTSSVSADQARGIWRTAARQCHDRLTGSGIPLDRYNTEASADDIAALLGGFGRGAWNVYGVSYGTRLALALLRRHPETVRSVILDSTYPPDVRAYVDAPANAARAFQALFSRCARSAACAKANPGLEVAFADVLRQVRQAPLVVALPGRPNLPPVVLDDAKLMEVLFYGFYGWGDIQRLPAALTDLHRGGTALLQPFVEEMVQTTESPAVSYGAFLSVECHDEWGFNPPDAVATAAHDAGGFEAFALANLPVVACPDWPAGTAAPETRSPVASDKPVLILSGELDPITPPDWAVRAAKTLPRSYLIRFPGIGHGVMSSHACSERIGVAFLTDPSRAPYDDCLLGLESARG